MSKEIIQTDNAPQAIGTYSQAVITDNNVYISGQIPLDPETMNLVDGDISAQIRQVFDNLLAIVQAANGDFFDVVKLNVYLTDLSDFPIVNEIMTEYFVHPYPARAVIGVAALPKDATVEIDAIMVRREQRYSA